jgi:KRAB domain-containing zinc finger protein
MVKKFYSVHECVKNQKKLLKKMEKVKTERNCAEIADLTVASKCSRCSQEFFNTEEFACHQFLECEDDNNQCSVCDKAFDTRRKLARHKRHHTYIEKTCICDICGHTSVNESQMRIHKARHSNERPFKCQSCPAAFKLDHMLKSHQIIHKEKEFECDICGKKFRNYHSIRLHMAVHADITDVRRFTCELCGKSTVSGTALTRHLKIHTSE